MGAGSPEGVHRSRTLLLFLPSLLVLVVAAPTLLSAARDALTSGTFRAPPEPCFLLDEATAARMAPGMARRGGDEASPGVYFCRWGHLVSPGQLQVMVMWFEGRLGTSADDLAQEGLNMIAADTTATAPPIGDEARLTLPPGESGPDVLAFRKANVVVEISYTPKSWSDDLLFTAARHIDRELAS